LTSATGFTGFNEAEQTSVYSNEVLSKKDTMALFPKEKGENPEDYYKKIDKLMTLKAKVGKEVVAEGFYKKLNH